MNSQVIRDKLRQKFPKISLNQLSSAQFICFEFDQNDFYEIAHYLKQDEELSLNFLESITIFEDDSKIKILYQLRSLKNKVMVGFQRTLSSYEVEVPSVSEFFSAARLYESEISEMFGIRFENLDALKPFLLPHGWVGFPLRKDYKFPDHFGGIDHARPNLRREHVRP